MTNFGAWEFGHLLVIRIWSLGIFQTGVFIPIALTAHHPFHPSNIMNAPATIKTIDVIHPACEAVRIAHRNISVMPSTRKTIPMISRIALPRESMLQVKPM